MNLNNLIEKDQHFTNSVKALYDHKFTIFSRNLVHKDGDDS